MSQLHFVTEYLILSTHNFLAITPNFRKGKHTAIARTHLDEVVGFFAKIDPILGDLVLRSKPRNAAADDASKRNASTANKRKFDVSETLNGSPKKKANVESNGSMTLSQREKRAMELLASYLEERGGMLRMSLLRRIYFSPINSTKMIPAVVVNVQGSECKVKTLDARSSSDQGDVTIRYFFRLKISASSRWPKLLDFSI